MLASLIEPDSFAEQTTLVTKNLVKSKSDIRCSISNAVVVILVLLVAVYSVATFRRNEVWQNQTALYLHGADTCLAGAKIQNNIGDHYHKLEDGMLPP